MSRERIEAVTSQEPGNLVAEGGSFELHDQLVLDEGGATAGVRPEIRGIAGEEEISVRAGLLRKSHVIPREKEIKEERMMDLVMDTGGNIFLWTLVSSIALKTASMALVEYGSLSLIAGIPYIATIGVAVNFLFPVLFGVAMTFAAIAIGYWAITSARRLWRKI